MAAREQVISASWMISSFPLTTRAMERCKSARRLVVGFMVGKVANGTTFCYKFALYDYLSRA